MCQQKLNRIRHHHAFTFRGALNSYAPKYTSIISFFIQTANSNKSILNSATDTRRVAFTIAFATSLITTHRQWNQIEFTIILTSIQIPFHLANNENESSFFAMLSHSATSDLYSFHITFSLGDDNDDGEDSYSCGGDLCGSIFASKSRFTSNPVKGSNTLTYTHKYTQSNRRARATKMIYEIRRLSAASLLVASSHVVSTTFCMYTIVWQSTKRGLSL